MALDVSPTAAPAKAPPPPPPPPAPPKPSPAEVADKKAQDLIDAHQQDECSVSLPVIGGINCHKDTDGVAVGKDIATLAKTDPAQARLTYDKAQAKTPDADERREVARGLVEGLSHEEMRQLAGTANGEAMLESARKELANDAGNETNQAAITRVESATKAADLTKSAEFKNLDPATQQRTLDQISRHQTDAAAVDNTIALVKSAGFQAATPATRGELLSAQDQHASDPIFRQGLENLANDSAFKTLSSGQQANAIHAFSDFARSENYQGKEGSWFFNWGAKTVSDADKRTLLGAMQQVVTSAARTPGMLDGVAHLTGADAFKNLSTDEKVSVLSQVGNYPDPKVIHNLERLIGKDWFQDFDTGDKQRALKLIAYMSYPRTGVDQAIIDNTLEKFLGDKAPYELELESIKAKPGNITFGHASDDTMTINEDLVTANNGKLESDPYGRKLSLDTIPHEINHLINGDEVKETFDYLNEEYRAWYVGFDADHGRPPTNDEALERWAYFLDPGSGYYDTAAKGALADKGEAAKIYDELSKLTGLTVDEKNYRQVLADLAADPAKFKTNPNGPAVVPPGNLDNH